jgi:four helix bundle protein
MSSETEAVEAQAADGSRRPDTRSRAFAYALLAIKLYQHLQGRKNGAGWILGNQYLRSACSVGANVEEAQAGESRADFIHKLAVAQKEARESLYWLRLLSESTIVTKRQLEPLMQETKEIVAIITLFSLNAKAGVGVSFHNLELITHNFGHDFERHQNPISCLF